MDEFLLDHIHGFKGVDVDDTAFYLLIDLKHFLSDINIVNNYAEQFGFAGDVDHCIKSAI